MKPCRAMTALSIQRYIFNIPTVQKWSGTSTGPAPVHGSKGSIYLRLLPRSRITLPVPTSWSFAVPKLALST